MAEQLLAKLKIKPIPKKNETFELKIRKPPVSKQEVEIKTKVIDKTNLDLINRDSFLLEIQNKPIISTKIEPQLPINVPLIKILENPVKLSRRLILVSKSLDQEDLKTKEPSKKLSKETSVKPSDKVSIKSKIKKIPSPIDLSITGPVDSLIIGDENIGKRLPKVDEKLIIRAPTYYMNNREIFINFITSLLSPYKAMIEKDSKEQTCDSSKKDSFSLLTHQKIVRDYINLYTPYRGLLLYHGLGSGKTCSSIGIAEGLKTNKKVIIMTPASLRTNYFEELKKCGDLLYKKIQYWEFIETSGNPELAQNLSYILSLPLSFINKNNGAWLVNVQKTSNYDSLTSNEKMTLDLQLTEMIKTKYKFINYNGLRNSHLQNMTADFTINPFDNAVVIVDEAHNLISRIVNKLKNKSALSMKLYEYLMTAENAKIIFLTGTPIINYPNEIGILFNILRGKIKTYKFKLLINESRKIDQKFINKLFRSYSNVSKLFDYVEYSPTSNTLTVTENPFGFISKYSKDIYEGVQLDESQDLTAASFTSKQFIKLITKLLSKVNIDIIPGGVEIELFKALPDTLEEFKNIFIDDKNNVKNENLFKRRIIGLTSYFPDIDTLLPKYDKSINFHVIEIPMSKFQFSIYE